MVRAAMPVGERRGSGGIEARAGVGAAGDVRLEYYADGWDGLEREGGVIGRVAGKGRRAAAGSGRRIDGRAWAGGWAESE